MLSVKNIFIAIAVSLITAKYSEATTRLQTLRETCGIPKIEMGMIVQGQDFPRGSFPWTVALTHTGWTPPKFFCAGTVISKTFVISAAHCILQKNSNEKFLPRDVLVIFGAHNLGNSFEAGRYQLSPKNIFVHDDWNPLTAAYDADLSLLEFESGSIHFNTFVQPICLWELENEPTVTEGVVTGWGKSQDLTKPHENIPKMVNAPIQTNEDCFLDTKALIDLSSNRTFCAGMRDGSGVCQGDSGGGHLVKIGRSYYLRGIVSSSLLNGTECDISRNAIYTNVLKFRDWIVKMTGGSLKKLKVTTSLIPGTSNDRSIGSPKNVFCIFKMTGKAKTCLVGQAIDSEDYVLESPLDTAVERFDINDNRNVKFIPQEIGEKFYNLKEFWAKGCDLSVVRKYFFKNMGNLQKVFLQNSRISSIEAEAFEILTKVMIMHLNNNLLETFDDKLFETMVNLEHLHLNGNKIKFLSPSTFRIPGGQLKKVYLAGNTCLHRAYPPHLFGQLETDIKAKCRK